MVDRRETIIDPVLPKVTAFCGTWDGIGRLAKLTRNIEFYPCSHPRKQKQQKEQAMKDHDRYWAKLLGPTVAVSVAWP